MEQCGGTVQNIGTLEHWNSLVERRNSVMEQCGQTVWNSMVEQCGTVCCNSGTVWHSVVEQCGGTVWNSMEQ